MNDTNQHQTQPRTAHNSLAKSLGVLGVLALLGSGAAQSTAQLRPGTTPASKQQLGNAAFVMPPLLQSALTERFKKVAEVTRTQAQAWAAPPPAPVVTTPAAPKASAPPPVVALPLLPSAAETSQAVTDALQPEKPVVPAPALAKAPPKVAPAKPTLAKTAPAKPAAKAPATPTLGASQAALNPRVPARMPASQGGTSRTVNSTAYNSEVGQTDNSPFITATGTRVRPGVVALSRDLLRIFPYGTRVTIQDSAGLMAGRVFIVEDTMNVRIANTVDVWMPNRSQAIQWGRRTIKITAVR
ncbi:hypothetical protein [Deinococcus sp.]|uniref:hypothetical protein n=1 Tax=Deinococcus sp. TaxID=47478 RepID=UPI003B593477